MSDARKAISSEDLLRDLQQNPEFQAEWELVDPSITLAANVCRLRVQCGWTQAELAEAAGMRQPRIAEIESGEANPRLDTVARIARALRVDVHSLFASCDGRAEPNEEAHPAPALGVPFSATMIALEQELRKVLFGHMVRRPSHPAVLTLDMSSLHGSAQHWGHPSPSRLHSADMPERKSRQWFQENAWGSNK